MDRPAKTDGGPAFPLSDEYGIGGETVRLGEPGMTLRDWLAGQIIGAMVVGYTQAYGSPTDRSAEMAKEAWGLADEMLRCREDPTP